LSDPVTAARETYEEVGIFGKVRRTPIGSFEYWKRLSLTCELVTIDVYALKVEGQRKKWPEKDAREFAWFALEEAAMLVDESARSVPFASLRRQPRMAKYNEQFQSADARRVMKCARLRAA
jgi:8-oxo-dGTP pyrophosphatase MutT (NUDIX family)